MFVQSLSAQFNVRTSRKLLACKTDQTMNGASLIRAIRLSEREDFCTRNELILCVMFLPHSTCEKCLVSHAIVERPAGPVNYATSAYVTTC